VNLIPPVMPLRSLTGNRLREAITVSPCWFSHRRKKQSVIKFREYYS
jgi:hypothetical protein